jgi:hypothetical protein
MRNKLIIIVFFISIWTLKIPCFSQISFDDLLTYKFDTINYLKEKTEVDKFIKDFISCQDSIKLQEFILFPFIEVRCSCNPLNVIHGNPYFYEIHNYNVDLKTDKDVRNFINSHGGCINPYAFYQIKYSYNHDFKDSLNAINLSLGEYFFSNSKNKTAFCSWYIKLYKEMHASIFTDNYFKTCVPNNHILTFIFNNKEVNIPILQFYFLSIFKYKGKYKVCYDGYASH